MFAKRAYENGVSASHCALMMLTIFDLIEKSDCSDADKLMAKEDALRGLSEKLHELAEK